jgi:hypothetical protein
VTARDDKEAFLSRWSRLKNEAKQPAPPEERPAAEPVAGQAAAAAKAPAPELPPLDKLTIDSDYRDFFHPKVDEGTRRAALKKLFSDPHFNVMDGLDVYIDDYSTTEPIPPAMLAGLRQAQKILEWAKQDEEERRKQAEQLAAGEHRELESPATASPSEIGFEESVPAVPPQAADGGGSPAKS